MFEVHHRLRTFCQHARTFKGNTDRAVKTLNFEIGSFLDQSGVQTITDIDRSKIEAYMLHGKTQKNWSAKTIRNRLISIRSFLDWCIEQQLRSDNPARSIPLPRLRRKLPEHLPKDDAFDLLEWTKSYNYLSKFEQKRAVAIIAMFIFAGLRHRELYNLNLLHIRLDDRTIFVKSGKGDKDRYVVINDELAIYLEDYVNERTKLKHNCPAFFVSLRGDQRIGENVIPRLVKKLRETSGIYFYPHKLRHTFATLMLEGGANVVAIKELMGHSDINTTMVYLSVTTGHLHSEIAKHSLTSTRAVIL